MISLKVKLDFYEGKKNISLKIDIKFWQNGKSNYICTPKTIYIVGLEVEVLD